MKRAVGTFALMGAMVGCLSHPTREHLDRLPNASRLSPVQMSSKAPTVVPSAKGTTDLAIEGRPRLTGSPSSYNAVAMKPLTGVQPRQPAVPNAGIGDVTAPPPTNPLPPTVPPVIRQTATGTAGDVLPPSLPPSMSATTTATRTPAPADSRGFSLPGEGTPAGVLPPPTPPLASRPHETRPAAEPAGPPAVPSIFMVNNKRIVLSFEIKDINEASFRGVQLWYTQDGKNWSRCETPPRKKSPYVLEVAGEGLFGFLMVPVGDNGVPGTVPVAGDLPQVWVLVDMKKPDAQLINVEPAPADPGSLVISWSAADENLLQRPVVISMAREPNGPWIPIAVNIRNKGQFLWPVSPQAPSQAYFRIEVTDHAGNRTVAQTPNPILINSKANPAVAKDPSHIEILGVESVD